MASEADEEGDGETLPPDDAFAVLGDETRLDILRELGDTGEALSFSELRDRVGIRDSSRFNYHLGKLTGHFVEKREAGYALRPAGERVIEAVLSGAVTDAPVLERTPIDTDCFYCGGDVEMSYREERAALYCTECAGTYGISDPAEVDGEGGEGDADSEGTRPDPDPDDRGFLGNLALPPAGLEDRTPTEAHRAARTWQMAEILPAGAGVCPRCSASLERSASVCPAHDAAEGLCGECGQRHAAHHVARCTNCVYDQRGALVVGLLAETEVLAFLTDHGIDPVAPPGARFSAAVLDYEEEIRSREPFEARLTLSVDGDELSLTVEEGLTVVETERRDGGQ